MCIRDRILTSHTTPFLMIRRPPRSTHSRSSAASDVYKRQAISIAMILNLIMAAVGGFLLPYILRKIGYDPAISGGVIITTITDLIGFVTFLGIVSFLVV